MFGPPNQRGVAPTSTVLAGPTKSSEIRHYRQAELKFASSGLKSSTSDSQGVLSDKFRRLLKHSSPVSLRFDQPMGLAIISVGQISANKRTQVQEGFKSVRECLAKIICQTVTDLKFEK